jgi:hypothetical protein
VQRVRRALGALGWSSAALLCLGPGRSAEAWPRADGASTAPLVAAALRGEVPVPSLDEVERMCALLTSCDKLPIPSTLFPADFQACVGKMTEEMASPSALMFSLTMRECALRADSCSSLRDCALHGASADSCKGRGRQGVAGFCDVEGRALTCWHDEVLAVRDCTRGAEQCVVVDGEATCTLGQCLAAASEGERPRCSASGTHLLHCEKGKLMSLDCTPFGLRCSTTGDGAAGCSTSGPQCSGATKRCEGNVAVGCLNGHEVRVECAAAGLQCAPSPGTIAVGSCMSVPTETAACGPTEKAKCDGSDIHYCYASRARSYSCKALGFNKCESGKRGTRCS